MSNQHSYYVIRGGGQYNCVECCRSACRLSSRFSCSLELGTNIGFRIAMYTVKEEKKDE